MACAPVALSWPKVEEVRCLPLILVLGLLSKAPQPRFLSQSSMWGWSQLGRSHPRGDI